MKILSSVCIILLLGLGVWFVVNSGEVKVEKVSREENAVIIQNNNGVVWRWGPYILDLPKDWGAMSIDSGAESAGER